MKPVNEGVRKLREAAEVLGGDLLSWAAQALLDASQHVRAIERQVKECEARNRILADQVERQEAQINVLRARRRADRVRDMERRRFRSHMRDILREADDAAT